MAFNSVFEAFFELCPQVNRPDSRDLASEACFGAVVYKTELGVVLFQISADLVGGGGEVGGEDVFGEAAGELGEMLFERHVGHEALAELFATEFLAECDGV